MDIRRGFGSVAAAMPHRIQQPIFVIAPPRSGSTFLFDALARLGKVSSLVNSEAEHIWWRVLPYSERSYPDDVIEPTDLGLWGRRQVRAWYYMGAVTAKADSRLPRGVIGARKIRYLDKTISNCFHLGLLADMFKDARFVFLVRDPRANIASMIEGWSELERFGKPALTPYLEAVSGATIAHWAFPAPRGWQEVVNRPLAEICAWTWQQHIESILQFRETTPGRLVRYEDLVADPSTVIADLAGYLDLSISEDSSEFLAKPTPSRTTLTPPRADKWREHRSGEIAAILPVVMDTVSRLGYPTTV